MAKEYRATKDTKIIWGRIGMFVEVSNDEYERYKTKCEDEELDMPEDLYELFKTKGKFGGNTYIPEEFWEGDHENDIYIEGEMW